MGFGDAVIPLEQMWIEACRDADARVGNPDVRINGHHGKDSSFTSSLAYGRGKPFQRRQTAGV